MAETSDKIQVFKAEPLKSGVVPSFELEVVFEFEKQFAEINMNEEIKSISLESYSDQENLIVILMKDGQMKVMSESIMRQMIEYANSVKKAVDEDSSSEDEEELARIRKLEAERKKFCYRVTRPCRKEEPLVARKKIKNKDLQTSKNQTLSAIRNLFAAQVAKNFFKVERYFMRRQLLYFQGAINGSSNSPQEIKRINISALKNTDAVGKS